MKSDNRGYISFENEEIIGEYKELTVSAKFVFGEALDKHRLGGKVLAINRRKSAIIKF